MDAESQQPSPMTKEIRTKTEEHRIRVVHVLVALASVGVPFALVMVARWLSEEFGVRVAGAMCLMLLWFGLRKNVRQLGDALEQTLNRNRPAGTPSPAATKRQSTMDWYDFTFYGATFMGCVAMVTVAGRGVAQLSNRESGHSLGDQPQSAPRNFEFLQRRARTLAYWQTAVVNLHQVRFSTPSGEEPASTYLGRTFRSLQNQVDHAKPMSTVDVDQDLVAMARRHLEVDSGFLQLKQKIDDLMKRENITADADTISDRMAEWQNIVARVQADPALSEKLPEEARHLLEDVFELEQKRVDELREIEIMRAVLQERYRGTKFPLPEIAQ